MHSPVKLSGKPRLLFGLKALIKGPDRRLFHKVALSRLVEARDAVEASFTKLLAKEEGAFLSSTCRKEAHITP
jgi:hypothetical protein